MRTIQERLTARDAHPRIAPRAKSAERPRNPLLFAASEWTRAIQETDAHSRSCRPCSRRRHPEALAKQTGTLVSIDPYRPCREADRLHEAEIATRHAYQAAGGALPIDRERLRRSAPAQVQTSAEVVRG